MSDEKANADEPAMLFPDVEWVNDCQGKKYCDHDLIRVSAQFWPRGGGFSVVGVDARGETTIEGNDARPGIPPSAKGSVRVNVADDESIVVAEKEFGGDSEDEVKAAVESWVHEQFARITLAVRREYADDKEREDAK